MGDWTREQAEYLFHFMHPEKLLGAFIHIPDDLDAVLWGFTESEYIELRKGIRNSISDKTAVLLSDPGFAEAVQSLPFKAGQVVVGFGDSITDYSMSWLELLRAVYNAVHGEGTVRFVNAGLSGDTSADMLRRFKSVIDEEPDWIITLAGTNDAKLYYGEQSRTFVSPDETLRNLSMIAEVAKSRLKSSMVWMTPPPVVEAMIRDSWLLQAVESVWLNRDLEEVAARVKTLGGATVDLQDVFGTPAKPEFFLEDGLHPSIDGEAIIVKSLVQTLTLETS